MDNYYSKKEETMSRDELEALKERRIAYMIRYVYDKVPFYKNLLDESGVKPEDFRTLDDLANMPFTKKDDLRETYPTGMFAVSEEETVRIHASSGTTGKPTVVGYTKNDLDTWTHLMARTLYTCGVRKHTTVQNTNGYGLFTGGLGFHYGAEKIGARIIPMSGGNSEKQIMLMKDLKSNCLIATPSYALHLVEVMEDMGISKDELSLESAVLGAEAWTDEMKERIESKMGLRTYNSFGMSEIMGPGVAIECEYQTGMHIWEDHFVPEIVDPKTLKPLPDGEVGELVVSATTKECLPLLRYRTRDLAVIKPGICECGRTFKRLDRIKGRTDDMLVIRGVNLFPSQIEEILLSMGGVEPHYQLVVTEEGGMARLEVKVEVDDSFFDDNAKVLDDLRFKIMDKIKSLIGISTKITLLEPKSIERSQGKAVRIVDKRKK